MTVKGIRFNDRFILARDLRLRRQSRYVFVGLGENKIAHVRWSDQLAHGSNIKSVIKEVQKRKNLETFCLNKIFSSQARSPKEDLSAVSSALSEYGAVSLPFTLVHPKFWEKTPVLSEAQGILLQSPDRSDRETPGCFICGGKEGTYYSITGIVKSREAFIALLHMFGYRGVSSILDQDIQTPNFASAISYGMQLASVSKNQYPVNIGACYDHLSIQGSLREYSVLQPRLITKEVIEILMAYDSPANQLSGTNYEWAQARANEDVQVGFRFF